MGRFQMTQEKIAQGQALVEQVETLDQAQEHEKGEAQRATKVPGDPQLLESHQFGAVT